MTKPTEVDPKRQAIIDRIRKLQAMSESRGASESEALTALEMCARLIQQHNVLATELTLKEDAKGCVKDTYMDVSGERAYWFPMKLAIAKLFNCHTWYDISEEDFLGIGLIKKVTNHNFYGFPEDVAACRAMMTLCHSAIVQETNREFTVVKRGKKSSTLTPQKMKEFHSGMGARLAERIIQLKVITLSNSTALVSLKGQLVDDKFKAYCADNDLHLNYTASPLRVDTGSNVFQAGLAAGSRVNLGHGAIK